MEKRLHLEMDGKIQEIDFKSLTQSTSTHELNNLPPCFSCSTVDCEAVDCIKLEIWFNRKRMNQIY